MTLARRELQWLRACVLIAPEFSTCSRGQYFAVVLAPNGRVCGIGYNGSPPGMQHCVDGGCPRALKGVEKRSDYTDCIASHAEMNALIWSDAHDTAGGTIVVNGTPCQMCAKIIASTGLRRVVYLDEPGMPNWDIVKEFFAKAGITIEGISLADLFRPVSCSSQTSDRSASNGETRTS